MQSRLLQRAGGARGETPLHSRDAGATGLFQRFCCQYRTRRSLCSRDGRRRPSLHKLAEGAGGVVEHGEGQQEDQEENCRGYDELQEFLAGTS